MSHLQTKELKKQKCVLHSNFPQGVTAENAKALGEGMA